MVRIVFFAAISIHIRHNYLPGEGWFQNARELAIPVIDVSAVLFPELR